MQWSFGRWLLNLFVISANWWQDFHGCDSLFGRVREHLQSCSVVLRLDTLVRWMSTLGHSSAIWTHCAQAQKMLRSHDAKGSLQMDMLSLGVMDLDLSISPDAFGLRAFDHKRLMLPDSTMGSDGFHEVIIDNLAATPAWRSSHVSPSDMTALRRRWPKAVFRTMRRHGPEMKRLRRGARHWPDRAFRHNAPGFCPVCKDCIKPALDVHMASEHLEMAQLWRCPVEWCAVWKGSVRACQEHLMEKHGGSSLFDLQNVTKFFPPWTVARHVWQTALRPDVSEVAVDARLFHESGCRLVHRYRVYRDPFPHPALRDGVIPRLLSCTCRAMAIARLTHLRISIPASGAPPGQVPADCFPGGAPRQNRPGALRVTFADAISGLAVESPTVGSPVLEEPAPLVSATVVEDVVYMEGEMCELSDAIPPPPGFPPFSWPTGEECVVIERFGSSLVSGYLPDATHGVVLRAGSTVGAGCSSAASHRQSP